LRNQRIVCSAFVPIVALRTHVKRGAEEQDGFDTVSDHADSRHVADHGVCRPFLPILRLEQAAGRRRAHVPIRPELFRHAGYGGKRLSAAWRREHPLPDHRSASCALLPPSPRCHWRTGMHRRRPLPGLSPAASDRCVGAMPPQMDRAGRSSGRFGGPDALSRLRSFGMGAVQACPVMTDQASTAQTG